MNKYDSEYKRKQLKVLKELEAIYGNLIDSLVMSVIAYHISESEYFRFQDHPTLKKKVDALIKQISIQLNQYINMQIINVWNLSNKKNDVLVESLYKSQNKIVPTSLKLHNEKALEVFQKSKINGLTLSDRVWNSNVGLRQELESALNAAVEKGQSAKSLAKDIKKYLNEPDRRFRRVRDKFRNLKLSANALRYNPGQGVYRSSQANALRLAKETINRAYREADYLRWQQMPFIVGYKLRNSERKATVCSICEKMNGTIFPKSHKFIGIHIGCLCTAIPIMCSVEEFKLMSRDESYVPNQPDMPESYN